MCNNHSIPTSFTHYYLYTYTHTRLPSNTIENREEVRHVFPSVVIYMTAGTSENQVLNKSETPAKPTSLSLPHSMLVTSLRPLPSNCRNFLLDFAHLTLLNQRLHVKA